MKTFYDEKPSEISIERVNGSAIIRFTENPMEIVDNEDGSRLWECDEYVLKLRDRAGIEEHVKENFAKFFEYAKEDERAKLADAVRLKRDILLKESDPEMCIDRFVGPDITAKIENALNGEWAAYRQALRDIPKQAGFPYNVVFPKKPNKGGTE